MSKIPKITVVGGLTMDLFYYVDTFPEIGKAVEAKRYTLTPGGKAFNLATALKRINADAELISSVGKDNLSEEIFETLVSEGFSIKGIIVQENVPTDLIGVLVSQSAVPGFIGTRAANYAISEGDIESKKEIITNADAVIVTLEIPFHIAQLVLQIAREAGVMTILNPAPPQGFSTKILEFVDYFIPNEWEARVGLEDGEDSISNEHLLKYFQKKGAKNSIITMQDKGSIAIIHNKTKHFGVFPVDAIDSTGSGDAYVANFVASLVEGLSEERAIRQASAAGALVATKSGSRNSMPTKQEIASFLQKNREVNL